MRVEQLQDTVFKFKVFVIVEKEAKLYDTHQLISNIRRAGLLQKAHMLNNGAQIYGIEFGRGHPCKLGKLVHHAPDIVDLPHDSFCALLKNLRFARDLVLVFAAYAISGELNGR